MAQLEGWVLLGKARSLIRCRFDSIRLRHFMAEGLAIEKESTQRIPEWKLKLFERTTRPLEHRAEEREAAGLPDLDVEQLTGEAIRIAIENDDPVLRGAA